MELFTDLIFHLLFVWLAVYFLTIFSVLLFMTFMLSDGFKRVFNRFKSLSLIFYIISFLIVTLIILNGVDLSTLNTSGLILNYIINLFDYLEIFIILLFLVLLFYFIKYWIEDRQLLIRKDEEKIIDVVSTDEPLNYKSFLKFSKLDTHTLERYTNDVFEDFLSNIEKRKNRSSQVLGLTASFGSGKTSFFRMVKGWYSEQQRQE
jgi:hypothetical protein